MAGMLIKKKCTKSYYIIILCSALSKKMNVMFIKKSILEI